MTGLLAMAAAAQPQSPAKPLSLDQAIGMAAAANPDLEAAVLAEAESHAREEAAKSSWYPRISVQEEWQRGDQPVFVFGSLLGQRRFDEANFAIDALNRPDPANNFRGAVSVSQPVYDGGRIVATSRQAQAAREVAEATRVRAGRDVAVAVVQAYASVFSAESAARAAATAVEAAKRDEALARDRVNAGMATEADALAVAAHLADMQAREIAAVGDARIARATLNRLMGVSFDSEWALADFPPGLETPVDPVQLEADALDLRPDVRAARWSVDLARAKYRAARAGYLPEVGVEGGYEWNGHRWTKRAGSWMVGVRAQWSLSLGGTERAASQAALLALERARAEQESTEAAARLDIRASLVTLEAARARVGVARASVEQAREGERIVRDRYEAGLAGVTDLLRASNALVDAEARVTAARAEATVAAVRLERAIGRMPEGR